MPNVKAIEIIGPGHIGYYLTEATDFANERRIGLAVIRNHQDDWVVLFRLKDALGPFDIEIIVRKPLKSWRATMNDHIIKARAQRMRNYVNGAGSHGSRPSV